ncbi:glycosyltransferase [Desulfosporosinus fructosivorans]|uniref:Glycosyltransferase n=1 Tax=Desulfosporosinus fructosivorans TaxID=2018669 RepID=A0A4Z0RBA8_9FIRM|nr:glycosyltransferase [Desulfosporosinus fructosivorans]TGE39734.1 glycosyltransferase [Desulfosporosinus fructosivorans]
MRLLVIQEQHFTRMPNGEVWVDVQSNQRFWDRYLNVFEEIVVCARFNKCEDYDTDGLMRSDRDRVSFVELPNYRGVGGLIKNYSQVSETIKRAIRQCDCVIFRAPSPISMVAYPLIKKSKKPFAVEIMNNPATQYSKQSMSHILQPLILNIVVNQTKDMCLKANGVSYVTERTLQELYPSTAQLKGESKSFFEGSYSTIRLDQENYCYLYVADIKVRPDPFTFINAGMMNDNRKGQDIFIEALSILHQRGYNVKGILVGEGLLRQEFEQLGVRLGIRDRLDFVGWKVGYADVQKELQRAKIAVFASYGEGLPRSMIEAMANGLLCFGTKIDGIVELLDDDLLVKEFSGEAFANKIEPFLSDWSCVEPIRNKLYERSKKYEYTILETKRNEFYKKLREVAANGG